MHVKIVATYDPETHESTATFHNEETPGESIDYSEVREHLDSCFAAALEVKPARLHGPIGLELRLHHDEMPELSIQVNHQEDQHITTEQGLAILARILKSAHDEVLNATAGQEPSEPDEAPNSDLRAEAHPPSSPEESLEQTSSLQHVPELRYHNNMPEDAVHHRRVRVVTDLNLDTGTYELSFENQSNPGEGIEYLEVRDLMSQIFRPRRIAATGVS